MLEDDVLSSAILESLKQNLDELSKEQLIENILQYSQELEKKAASSFFQIISFSNERSEEEEYFDATLENDSQVFYQRLLENHNDEQDELSQEDIPSWMDELEILFERCDICFNKNHYQIAALSYGNLFEALNLAEEIAAQKHSYSIQDVILIPIKDAKAKYLRSLYEILPYNIAPNHMLNVLKKFSALANSQRVGLVALKEIKKGKLKDFKQFLESWLKLLHYKYQKDDNDFNYYLKWLLREGYKLKDGFNGLYYLASIQGSFHHEIYFDIIDMLIKEKNYIQAQEIVKEGILKLEDKAKKAVLCDWLSQLYNAKTEQEEICEIRKQAWYYNPTIERFIYYLEVNNKDLNSTFILNEVKTLKENFPFKVRLICRLELLAGEFELPIKSLLIADPLGWSAENHPGQIVYPFLLLASGNFPTMLENTSLKIISYEMESLFNRWQLQENKNNNISYLNYLKKSLANYQFSEGERENFLVQSKVVLLDRIEVVVTRRLDHVFDNISHLLIAYIEICYLIDEKQRALKLLYTIKSRYAREILLRNKIYQFFNESEILPQINHLGHITNG